MRSTSFNGTLTNRRGYHSRKAEHDRQKIHDMRRHCRALDRWENERWRGDR